MASLNTLARVLVAAAPVLLGGCGEDGLSLAERDAVASLSLDGLGAAPPSISNKVADDPGAAALGKALFFDTRLSANGAVACATCHDPQRQFQDDLPRAQALGTGPRRTMSLAGVAWNLFFFWDGRKDSLWSQALEPLENPLEHGMTRTGIVRLVARHHRAVYEAVFGPLPALGVLPAAAGPAGTAAERAAWAGLDETARRAVNGAFANVGKAIAAFERTIPPLKTRFDRYAAAIARGEPPEGDAAFSDLEREGLRLFVGSANCLECHNGPRFTDDHFHNTGVADDPQAPAGRERAGAIARLLADPFNCLGAFSDADEGDCAELRFMLRDGPELERAFKTPSLRGVAQRAPYMHAGQIATLEAVVEHYANAPTSPAGTSELRPVRLTERGKAALVAFLKTLN